MNLFINKRKKTRIKSIPLGNMSDVTSWTSDGDYFT